MQTEHVTVTGNGAPCRSWAKVTVRAAVKEACRSFTLVVAAEGGAQLVHGLFRSGAPVTIKAGDDLLFTGYADRRHPQMTAAAQSITVSGRSNGQDAVDSSALHDTGRFEKKTPLEIAKAIDATGTQWSADGQLDPVPEYQLTPGATVFREVERLCRDQAMTLSGGADGGIVITSASNGARHAGALTEGVNILEAHADHNDANRHSEVRVRGQSYDGHGKAAHRIEAVATDAEIGRKRPKIHVVDGNTDLPRAKKRAKHHRDRAAGNARRASIKVQGWRDDAGALWTPGRKVFVESPFLDIEQDMLVESVDFDQSTEETTATLGLVDPRAYGGKAGKAASSGGEWSMDDSAAS